MKLTRRVLYHKAKPVDFRYPEQNRILAQNMLRLMRSENGIGLAATQIGVSRRVFVIELDQVYRECFNPEIITASSELTDLDEGCLSFPGDRCIIKRPEWIDARYQNYQGQWYTERLVGIAAKCFQHELDHLNGITMWDRHKEQHAEQSRN